MKIHKIAKEKLIEKHIDWKQAYTPKTEYLKRQFDAVVGKGSYFRFEGKAADGSEYYCILSPARVHKPIAKFFAGVRKLPATYSAGGKYFDSFDRAAVYAQETWGVKVPKELKPYTAAQLYGISKRITEWKSQQDDEESSSKSEKESKYDVEYPKSKKEES